MPTNVRDAVFQNCVFQLSAVLEDYLAGVLAGWFDRLQHGGALNANLPVQTRLTALLRIQEEAFRRYAWDRDESKYVSEIGQGLEALRMVEDTRPIPQLEFAKLIVNDKKFPSVRNLDKLFRRLGILRMFGRLSARTKSTFDLNLQSFMDIRNALAHEAPPSVTDIDVSRYFNQIDAWIAAIDRELYSHIVAASGSDYWR